MAVADYAASVGLPDIERRTATTEYEFQHGHGDDGAWPSAGRTDT
ncbi:MAG: hypothetical protein QOF88_4182 [Mycobacterium sp.]|jgi:hypothetical protein|nr:hypothetical protein [Mycobacterium sp.]